MRKRQHVVGVSVAFATSAILFASGCSVASAAAPAPAHPHPVLVELFTSEGCSSCPAADAFVRELPRLGFGRDRVIPLAFHVDYWDDLGWKDPFASPDFTERQRAYARSGRLVSPGGADGISGPYTPQMIVGGHVHFSGGRRELARQEIERAEREPAVASLSAHATLEAERAHVTAKVASAERADAQKGWRLMVAVALKEARTAVRHGENAGEVLSEVAIVKWLSAPLAISTTTDAAEIDVPKPPGVAWKDVDLVAFVQSATTRRVVAVRAIETRVGGARARRRTEDDGRSNYRVARQAGEIRDAVQRLRRGGACVARS